MARGEIVERLKSDDGTVMVKIYDTGKISLNVTGRGAHVIEQAWLTGGAQQSILLLSPTEKSE